jgi:hypothetical protein
MFKNVITKLFLLLFLLSRNSNAMEGELEDSTFNDLSQKLKEMIVADIVPASDTVEEAIKNLYIIRTLHTSLALNDPEFTQHFVKDLHKKFKISKIFARFRLNTQESQKQLLERVRTISQFAFLHHNDLLRERKEKVEEGRSMVAFALEQACDALHQKRKSNTEFWKNETAITDEYCATTKPNQIFVTVDAYKYHYEGKKTAVWLLYLAENIAEILQRPTLKPKVKTQLRKNNLFAILDSEVFDDFYYPEIYVGKTPAYKSMEKRIK